MQASSIRNADVIVLSDSDDEQSNFNLPSTGVSITISEERPLDLGLFMPSTSDYGLINSIVSSCSSSQVRGGSTLESELATENVKMVQKLNSFSRAQSNSLSIRRPLKASFHNSASSSTNYDLIDYCCESYDPNAPAFDATQINNSFKCTVGACKCVLSNNVSLMFHLWSHLVSCRSFGMESPISELEKLCMCPQCLSIFPSPYRLHQHYTDAHGQNVSTSTCLICEVVVDKERHLVHDSPDAPYHCKKCRYRTSVRTHFLDHFVRFHSNTSALLCPFCLYTFNAPRAKDSEVVIDRQYTGHLFLHLKGKQFKCEQCALKFLNKTDKLNHKKDHAKLNPKWETKAYIKRSRRKGLRLWPQQDTEYCIECFEDPVIGKAHWMRTYSCDSCNYKTNCSDAFQHHKSVDCGKTRLGITRKRAMGSLESYPYFFCETSSTKLMLLDESVDFETFSKLEGKSGAESSDSYIQLEEKEADLFAVRKKMDSNVSLSLSLFTTLKTEPHLKVVQKHSEVDSMMAFAKRQFISSILVEEPWSFTELLEADSI